MLYRAIVVLMFAFAAGVLLGSYPGTLLKDPVLVSETDHDAQMIELRQRAHEAMVRLQSRQQAYSCTSVSDNNQRACDDIRSNAIASAKVNF